MWKIRLFILFYLATCSLERTYSQSELTELGVFLSPIINNDIYYGKKYCFANDSIELNEKWTNKYPIDIWMFVKPSQKTMTLLYLQNHISQFLIENVEDTIGLAILCDKFKISNCALFKGYGDWQKGGRKTNWIILFQLGDSKNKIKNFTKVEIWDSTAYYVNVLKNPLFNYEYGFACYESGEPPLGRYAISYLQKKDKMTLLKDITGCNNNEGLMYMIEYYIRQNLTLPQGFEKALQRKISYCDGCTDSGTMTIAKMIKELDNDSTSFGYYLKEEYY